MKLKGYRTIIANVVALGVAIAASSGFVIPESEQTALVAGIVAILNIGLRFITDTPVGGRKEED